MESKKSSQTLFNQAKANWLEHKKKHFKASTISVYERVIKSFTNAEEIDEIFWKENENNGGNTKRQHLNIVNDFISHINQNFNFNAQKVVGYIKYQKTQKQALKPLEMNSIRYFIHNHSTIQEQIAIELLFETGIRIEEINDFYKKIGLWNYESWIILNTKGNMKRQIKISKKLQVLIKSCWDQNISIEWLGTTASRKNRIAKIGKEANLKRSISAHIFRHTAITSFYRLHKDLVLTQKFAGHANSETTLNYITTDLEDLGQAIDLKNEFNIDQYDLMKLKELSIQLIKENKELKERLQLATGEVEILKGQQNEKQNFN